MDETLATPAVTPAATPAATPALQWQHEGTTHSARWRSERAAAPPRQVLMADDTLSADAAFRLANAGTALLWQGDFHNARQLLLALARRAERVPRRKARSARSGAGAGEGAVADTAAAAADTDATPGADFHRHRQAQAQQARVLSALLIPIDGIHAIPLPRAPDHRRALAEVWGPPDGAGSVMPLRDLLGIVSAHEWRKKGVPVPALGAAPDNRIHPHHGVFSPLRGEYVDLVAQADLPAAAMPGADDANGTNGTAGPDGGAFDIGTGTGVLAALLARRGVRPVVATDNDDGALTCAQENIDRLGLGDTVQLLRADLFPPGKAALIVCNPPWLPARAGSAIERAVYDEDSRMLRGFLAGLAAHLLPGGEGWLILSDLAEHLGLRTRAQLLGWIAAAQLQVLGRTDTRPRHPKVQDTTDPLHAARAAEVTSLWRLGAA